MRMLLLAAMAASMSAWSQPDDGYRKLMNGYRDAFRVLGRSKACGLNFDAEPHYREVARRHGEKSEAMEIARLSYTAAAENLQLSREIDPKPPAPMPCDVVQYMREMRLPELPSSLRP